ncbi:MAG: hypothetical protein WBV94_20630 [Blastocatellia bacterium]
MPTDEAIIERLVKVEGDIKYLRESYAPLTKVIEMLSPMRESIIRIENSIANLTCDITDLTVEGKKLYGLHEQVLQARAEQERQLTEEKIKKLNERTFQAFITNRLMPVCGAIVIVATILGFIWVAFKWAVSLAK